MQIKATDNGQSEIEALQTLLLRSDLIAETRQLIEQEIRNIRAGVRAEQDAAYQMEFYVNSNQRIMTIHDLRLDFEGRAAQIDHLVITSLLDIWLCESKHFSEGVSINKYGEWSAYYRGNLTGVPSPIEQNKKHAIVLEAVLKSGLVDLPKRFGVARRPTIKTVVLVSKDARIERPDGTPAAHVEGLDSVIKCDQFVSVMDQAIDKKSARDLLLGLVWLGTIERFARQLAALHKPTRIDWHRKFNIPLEVASALQGRPERPVLTALAPNQQTADRSASTVGICELCRRNLSPKEVAYCQTNAVRLRSRMLCYDCQRGARRIS